MNRWNSRLRSKASKFWLPLHQQQGCHDFHEEAENIKYPSYWYYFKHFNFGFEIADWWLFLIFIGSTQHIWHGWWTAYGLVCFGDFGSVFQLNCKYKKWKRIKLTFPTIVASLIFLICKYMIPLISVIIDLPWWLKLLTLTLLGCRMNVLCTGTLHVWNKMETPRTIHH